MLLTISNLYPRPDELHRGLFNAQLFAAMNKQVDIENICLVPEWRVWQHENISGWQDPCGNMCKTHYVPYFYMPVVGRSLSWRSCAYSLKKQKDLFKECDAVLATWLYPDGVAAAELARIYEKPIWLKVHGTDRFHLQNSARRELILLACDYAEGIICNAEFMKNELMRLGVPKNKLRVIPNGVNTDLFFYRKKDAAEDELSVTGRELAGHLLDAQSPIVLFVGHLVDIKGVDLLLKAWAELRKVRDDGRLVIIGEGTRHKQLELMADELGISESVMFMGECDHKEIALWMNIADCLCLSSRSEGMPNVVLEALASGLPVVATDVGDCSRVLDGEAAARIVPVENHAALAGGLSELLNIQIDRDALSKRQQQQLSWDKCAEEHIKEIVGVSGYSPILI